MKVPFMLVIGEREMTSGSVALRKHGEGDKGVFPLAEALEFLISDCATPALPEWG
jgi:threonyl-tRNA synthetase